MTDAPYKLDNYHCNNHFTESNKTYKLENIPQGLQRSLEGHDHIQADKTR